MKKFVLPLLAAVLAVSACGILSSETREEKAAREAQEAKMVRQAVETGEFTINIDRMYPLRGPSKMVSNYSIKLKDDVLISYLPFIGQAWRVPYGGGHALNFDAPIINYSAFENGKDGYEIRIYVKTDEDEHLYRLTLFDNGRANLDVHSQNRDRISTPERWISIRGRNSTTARCSDGAVRLATLSSETHTGPIPASGGPIPRSGRRDRRPLVWWDGPCPPPTSGSRGARPS